VSPSKSGNSLAIPFSFWDSVVVDEISIAMESRKVGDISIGIMKKPRFNGL
jgi:hypothetical protein